MPDELVNQALFCGINDKYTMLNFIVDVVHDFGSSLRPNVGRGFLYVSNVFLLSLGLSGKRGIVVACPCPSALTYQSSYHWIPIKKGE